MRTAHLVGQVDLVGLAGQVDQVDWVAQVDQVDQVGQEDLQYDSIAKTPAARGTSVRDKHCSGCSMQQLSQQPDGQCWTEVELDTLFSPPSTVFNK